MPRFRVHHIDGDATNNRPGNLQVVNVCDCDPWPCMGHDVTVEAGRAERFCTDAGCAGHLLRPCGVPQCNHAASVAYRIPVEDFLPPYRPYRIASVAPLPRRVVSPEPHCPPTAWLPDVGDEVGYYILGAATYVTRLGPFRRWKPDSTQEGALAACQRAAERPKFWAGVVAAADEPPIRLGDEPQLGNVVEDDEDKRQERLAGLLYRWRTSWMPDLVRVVDRRVTRHISNRLKVEQDKRVVRQRVELSDLDRHPDDVDDLADLDEDDALAAMRDAMKAAGLRDVEVEILTLPALGWTDDEVAERLGRTPGGVKVARSRARKKLEGDAGFMVRYRDRVNATLRPSNRDTKVNLKNRSTPVQG